MVSTHYCVNLVFVEKRCVAQHAHRRPRVAPTRNYFEIAHSQTPVGRCLLSKYPYVRAITGPIRAEAFHNRRVVVGLDFTSNAAWECACKLFTLRKRCQTSCGVVLARFSRWACFRLLKRSRPMKKSYASSWLDSITQVKRR